MHSHMCSCMHARFQVTCVCAFVCVCVCAGHFFLVLLILLFLADLMYSLTLFSDRCCGYQLVSSVEFGNSFCCLKLTLGSNSFIVGV